MQPVLRPPDPSDLLAGIAAVDRSGRLREQVLVSALGWHAHDRLSTEVRHDRVVLRREPDGPFHIDSRDQVFLPAGNRAVLSIGTGDRVLLVASPERGELIIHPHGVCCPALKMPISAAL
jgi:bifunctional DNA-binding transcriptional regulator/antitoxin component of YhaV-PrlF toxin-antitoxin module